MTKLEELARQLRDMAVDYEHEDSDRNKMQHEMLVAIETALKPLLDALESARSALDMEGFDESAERLREQLSQWRSRP